METSMQSVQKPTKEQMMLEIAYALSQRSHDNKTKVGCVITDLYGREIYGIGYNGNAAGGSNERLAPSAEVSGQSGLIHAEVNAIFKAVRMMDRLGVKDAHMYVTHAPCAACANLIVQSSIVTAIYYGVIYRTRDGLEDRSGIDILRSAYIPCYPVPIP